MSAWSVTFDNQAQQLAAVCMPYRSYSGLYPPDPRQTHMVYMSTHVTSEFLYIMWMNEQM